MAPRASSARAHPARASRRSARGPRRPPRGWTSRMPPTSRWSMCSIRRPARRASGGRSAPRRRARSTPRRAWRARRARVRGGSRLEPVVARRRSFAGRLPNICIPAATISGDGGASSSFDPRRAVIASEAFSSPSSQVSASRSGCAGSAGPAGSAVSPPRNAMPTRSAGPPPRTPARRGSPGRGGPPATRCGSRRRRPPSPSPRSCRAAVPAAGSTRRPGGGSRPCRSYSSPGVAGDHQECPDPEDDVEVHARPSTRNGTRRIGRIASVFRACQSARPRSPVE